MILKVIFFWIIVLVSAHKAFLVRSELGAYWLWSKRTGEWSRRSLSSRPEVQKLHNKIWDNSQIQGCSFLLNSWSLCFQLHANPCRVTSNLKWHNFRTNLFKSLAKTLWSPSRLAGCNNASSPSFTTLSNEEQRGHILFKIMHLIKLCHRY